jgi:hypothetical protein
MATVHSSRTCLPKLCCSIAAVGLFIAGILLTGAYPHPDLGDLNLNQTDAIANETNLASTGNLTLATERFTAGRVSRSLGATVTAAQNKALQSIFLAYIFRNTDIQAAILHKLFNQASNSKSRVSRSPRAIKMIQALEEAIAKLQTNKPKPEYQISEYTTGSKQWKREPSVYPFQVTDLLEYEVRNKHSQNKILGEKVTQILHQNTDLSDKIAIRKAQLWPWSQGRSPHICSLNTARTVKKNPNQKICLHGENHFSKRRSESENYSQYDERGANSDTNDKIKNIRTQNKEKLMTLLIDAKTEVTAKLDKVKAMKDLKEFEVEKKKQLDQKIKAESPVALPPHFATTFCNSSWICIHPTFTHFSFNFSICNPFVSDPADHHFQTCTIGDLSNGEMLNFSRQTASVQAETLVKALATADPIRLFKVLEARPDLCSRHLPRNPLVPIHLLSGRARKSETNLYHDSFTFNYLDFFR